jgi:hypothetical protein
MSDNVQEAPQTAPITKEEYYAYSYHKNVVRILEKLEKRDEKIEEIYQKSKDLSSRIESEFWKTHRQRALEETVKTQTPTTTEAEEAQALIEKKACESQISKQVINEYEAIDQWITSINTVRIGLGIVRNIFTFCLEETVLSEYTKDINRNNSLLAAFLYPLRLINEFVKVLMYAIQNKTNDIGFWEIIKGYYKTFIKKFSNDVFWTFLLIGLNLSIFIQDTAAQAFFQNELTSMLFSWIIVIGFLFDVYNEYASLKKREDDFNQLLKNLAPDETLEKELRTIYENEEKEAKKNYYEALCYCGLFFLYAIVDVAQFLTHAPGMLFPALDLVFTVFMFIIRVGFIMSKTFEKDFESLEPEKKIPILQEIYSTLISEMLKIMSVAIVIFCIAATIPYGGLPAMFIIGAILFALISATNLITQKIIEPYIIKPLLESSITPPNETSLPSKPVEDY